MSTLVLVKGMGKRTVIETYRYSFEFLSSIAIFYLLFVILFFGARALIGDTAATGGTLSQIVVGYMVWMLAILSYSLTTQDVTQEATAGTLEQLGMSPFGLGRVMAAKFVASFAFTLSLLAVVLLLMMATTGRWLHLDLLSLIPLFVLTIAGVFGVGLALAGVAIVFKKVQSLLQVVQFLFVALIAVPLDRMPAFKYLPLAWGNELIGRVMVDGTSIFRLPVADIGFLVAHAAVWLAVGFVAFRRFELVARDRALLGHY